MAVRCRRGEGSDGEEEIDPAITMAARLRELLLQENDQSGASRKRKIVLLAGGPGSGKTTLAERAASLVRENARVCVLPMDGFHIRKAQLDAEGLQRRGAPFTFDLGSLIAAMKSLRAADSADMEWPRFDHARGDPSAPGDGICVTRDDTLILIEGNYLLLERAVSPDGSIESRWGELASFANECWFVTCDADEANSRLVARHMAANNNTQEEAWTRVRTNDSLNFALIHESFLSLPNDAVHLVVDNSPTKSPSVSHTTAS